jgi:hypothetical protein
VYFAHAVEFHEPKFIPFFIRHDKRNVIIVQAKCRMSGGTSGGDTSLR